MSRRPTRRRRQGGDSRWLIPTLLLFVIVPVGGALAVAIGGRGDGGGGGGSTSPGDLLLPTRTPQSYAITYEVIDTTRSRPTRTTERIRVRRPFESRVEVLDNSGRVVNERLSSLGSLASRGGDQQWRELALGPALATGDLRPAPALREAVDRGWVEGRGRRTVLGRRCQVFRAGSSVASGTLRRLQPGGREHADACIDEAGLVLDERWHIGGRQVQHRVARRVEESPRLDAAAFALPAGTERVEPDDGGGSSVAVTREGLPPGFFLDLPEPPGGFEHKGRYAVVPPRVDVGRNPLSPASSSISTAITDVWVRGADMLVVEQGTVTDPNVGLPEPTEAVDVDLGSLGRGTGYLDLRTNEVRVQLPAGAFVRVFGTLPLRDLTAVARSLQPRTDGTGLVPA